MTRPADAVVSAVAPALDERQAFEKWADDYGISRYEETRNAYFVAWQARASLSADGRAVAPPAIDLSTLRDTARLDWLQSQWADGVHVEVCAAGGPTWHQLAPAVSVFLGSLTLKAKTVRDAIDAAIASEADSPGPAGATARTTCAQYHLSVEEREVLKRAGQLSTTVLPEPPKEPT